MAVGELVDDATMAEVVRERLAQPDAGGGFLLDGYPRTLAQAETLDGILAARGETLDAAVFLEVPEEELVRRMSGRREQAGRADDTRGGRPRAAAGVPREDGAAGRLLRRPRPAAPGRRRPPGGRGGRGDPRAMLSPD